MTDDDDDDDDNDNDNGNNHYYNNDDDDDDTTQTAHRFRTASAQLPHTFRGSRRESLKWFLSIIDVALINEASLT